MNLRQRFFLFAEFETSVMLFNETNFRVIEDSETLTFIDGNAFGKLRNLGKMSVHNYQRLLINGTTGNDSLKL